MKSRNSLKICFMGGKQTGIIGVLTVLSKGNRILSAVSYSENLTNILIFFGIPVYKSVNDKHFIKNLSEADVLLSVHGREIVEPDLLQLPKFGAINVHPYLYKYKGANPVGRALKDKEVKASVGVHVMDEQIDQGDVFVEEFIDVSGANSVEEIYNRLYPCYCSVILKILDRIQNENKKHQELLAR